MYKNRYASGLAGSDATSTHPLPPTTSHNQPQFRIPSGTIATAALQNHRDHPHLAGNEACLCSSCHIRDRFFPRSQDGRIVLPHPSLSIHSGRLSRPTTTSMASATPPHPTPSIETRKRSRTESTVSNRDLRLSVAKFNEGRRGGGLKTHLQSDIGEGSSGSTVAPRVPDEPPHTPQMSRREEQGGRSFSATKRTKHDHQPKPWPRNQDSEDFMEQTSHQSSSSQHMQPLDTSRKTRLEFFLDKHGTVVHPQHSLQSPQARERSPETTKLETPGSTTLTAHQTHISGYGYERHPISPSPHQGRLALNMSSYSEAPGRLEHHPSYHRPYSASRPESPTNVALHKPKIIKFSSRSENPQPDKNPASTTTSAERSVNSSPTQDPTPPSSSSYLLPPQFEEGSSGPQTQFRFQEPVVPEDHVTSSIRPRELSIVQVKWDSERKRRQGYFAQEEGAEKSPFRHYNKANCDFES